MRYNYKLGLSKCESYRRFKKSESKKNKEIL